MDKTLNTQHKELAMGRWEKLSFCEQMANVGSEVSRAFNWRKKGKDTLAENAVNRALELLDLTIGTVRQPSRLKELLRARECLVDYFYGSNEYLSSEQLLRRYFDIFAFALRGKT